MQELLERVLSDPAARTDNGLPLAAAEIGQSFAPWNSGAAEE